jgi:hypothetical protein
VKQTTICERSFLLGWKSKYKCPFHRFVCWFGKLELGGGGGAGLQTRLDPPLTRDVTNSNVTVFRLSCAVSEGLAAVK